jgi:hypothetical protein
MANNLLLGHYFQFVLELVAKIHEYEKRKYVIVSLMIIFFLVIVIALVFGCIQQKVLSEGRHTSEVHKRSKKRFLFILFYQKYMFFGGLFGSYFYIDYSFLIFRIGCEWPPSELF